jgi:hypothetical protein
MYVHSSGGVKSLVTLLCVTASVGDLVTVHCDRGWTCPLLNKHARHVLSEEGGEGQRVVDAKGFKTTPALICASNTIAIKSSLGTGGELQIVPRS